ncbi:MAG: NirD/YgiW/YdeI family stress tolerance protein [Burkholderiaceae bacterium]
MRKQVFVTLAALSIAAAAHAQYTGPSEQPAATTVKQLLDAGKDDQLVTLRGHIVKRIGEEKYQFADETGEIPIKIERENWPAGQTVNETSTVELSGKYDKPIVGASKVKIRGLKVVQ